MRRPTTRRLTLRETGKAARTAPRKENAKYSSRNSGNPSGRAHAHVALCHYHGVDLGWIRIVGSELAIAILALVPLPTGARPGGRPDWYDPPARPEASAEYDPAA
jgi:hypothetical protein